MAILATPHLTPPPSSTTYRGYEDTDHDGGRPRPNRPPQPHRYFHRDHADADRDGGAPAEPSRICLTQPPSSTFHIPTGTTRTQAEMEQPLAAGTDMFGPKRPNHPTAPPSNHPQGLRGRRPRRSSPRRLRRRPGRRRLRAARPAARQAPAVRQWWWPWRAAAAARGRAAASGRRRWAGAWRGVQGARDGDHGNRVLCGAQRFHQKGGSGRSGWWLWVVVRVLGDNSVLTHVCRLPHRLPNTHASHHR